MSEKAGKEREKREREWPQLRIEEANEARELVLGKVVGVFDLSPMQVDVPRDEPTGFCAAEDANRACESPSEKSSERVRAAESGLFAKVWRAQECANETSNAR